MKHTQCVNNFVSSINEMGGIVEVYPCPVTGGSVSVIIKGSANFDATLSRAKDLMRTIPGGHSWGTDGIGYVANKAANVVELHKSINKSVASTFVNNVSVRIFN